MHSNTQDAQTLPRYLSRDVIVSGEAIETTKRAYEGKNRCTEAFAAVPDAWREPVETH
ncbi:MAG TPA: hypothetical protein VL171_02245 [Verrucomicrobiae bacterium]|nr:hypothetical protein [Verrucomicrobiae bacterium]